MRAKPLSLGGPGEAISLLAVLVGCELLAGTLLPTPASRTAQLWSVGGLRTLELLVLGLYGGLRGWRTAALGLTGHAARRGLWLGVRLSAGMAVAVVAAEAIVRLGWQGSFLSQLSGARPSLAEWISLLLVGGLLAPAFEELVFRGVLYGSLRQRLPAAATALVVTVLFAAAHLPAQGIPWVQAAGGLLFCAAYERSASLWAPLVVHAAGNFALFLLPLWF